MNFTTWINNHPAAGLLSETDIKNMRVAWDVVADEAIKIARNYHDSRYDAGYQIAGQQIANKIKELK